MLLFTACFAAAAAAEAAAASSRPQGKTLRFIPCGAKPETWSLRSKHPAGTDLVALEQNANGGCLAASVTAGHVATIACNSSDAAQVWHWNGTARNVLPKGGTGFVRSALPDLTCAAEGGAGSNGCCLTNNGEAALWGCCPYFPSDCGNQVIRLQRGRNPARRAASCKLSNAWRGATASAIATTTGPAYRDNRKARDDGLRELRVNALRIPREEAADGNDCAGPHNLCWLSEWVKCITNHCLDCAMYGPVAALPHIYCHRSTLGISRIGSPHTSHAPATTAFVTSPQGPSFATSLRAVIIPSGRLL